MDSPGRFHKVAVLCLAVALAVPTTGCRSFWWAAGGTAVGIATGAAVLRFIGGDLEGPLEGDPREVARAAEQAFADLGIGRETVVATGLDALVVGRTATDKKVKVEVKAAGSGSSAVSVRIGFWGDEAASLTVYQAIRDRLKAERKGEEEGK